MNKPQFPLLLFKLIVKGFFGRKYITTVKVKETIITLNMLIIINDIKLIKTLIINKLFY